MDSLEKAIKEITYLTSKYPEEAIRIIEAKSGGSQAISSGGD